MPFHKHAERARPCFQLLLPRALQPRMKSRCPLLCCSLLPASSSSSPQRLHLSSRSPRSPSPSPSPSSSAQPRKAKRLRNLFVLPGEAPPPPSLAPTFEFMGSVTGAERVAALQFFSGATFLTSNTDPDMLPPGNQPEFAFVGRSNVGKSSLLNALLEKPGLARTSNTPGCTQTINLFECTNRVRMVDLPGYGYAKAPRDEAQKWHQFVTTFLSTRKAISVLVDSRRGVSTKDTELMELLNRHGLPHHIILTKVDKLSLSELHTTMEATRESTKQATYCSPILYVSSKDGIGVMDLRVGLMRAALKSG